jgi:hypothetical protein
MLTTTLLAELAAALVAEAPAKDSEPMREVVAKGYRVQVDLTPQILSVSIPEDWEFGGRRGKAEVPLNPTPQGLSTGGFVSGSLLAQKAKQFDDGLYAAVEVASQRGAGRMGSKSRLLDILAVAFEMPVSGASGNIRDVVLGAGQLGGLGIELTPEARSEVDRFLGDPLRSQPIGFYTWNEDLARIFRQDRMLQTELNGPDGLNELARTLHRDQEARSIYEGMVYLAERLTNPLAGPDLRPALAALDKAETPTWPMGLAFLPPSRAQETDLIMQLYGDRPIPEGFNLADAMIDRIRAGTLSLAPRPISGWYDHQTWALEPLVVPERMPEAHRLKLDESYRKQLLALFKAVLALTRESHVKQLISPAVGAAMRGREVVIHVAPELAAEPLPTYYLRRAESYRFVHEVLTEFFGAEALRTIHRLTPGGPMTPSLADELATIERLFLGASATIRRQLGMPAQAQDQSGTDPVAAEKAFASWARALDRDPDLGRDARMMVPVFYDIKRKQTKVWALVGWVATPVTVGFATPPRMTVLDAKGQPAPSGAARVEFDAAEYSIAYPVTAEVYVQAPLDRNQFRKLCDKHRTASAILQHLK